MPPLYPYSGAITISGTVNAKSVYFSKDCGAIAGSATPVINFPAEGTIEHATVGTVGLPALAITGAATSLTWKMANNLNIQSVTSNAAGKNILQGPGRLVVNNTLNLGALTTPLIFDFGTLKVRGTPLTNFSTIGHTVVFNIDRPVGLNIVEPLHTFTVDQALNMGTGGFTKAGLGTVVLPSSNSYSGVTAVQGGTVRVGANAPSGSSGSFDNATSDTNFGIASGNDPASILTTGAFTVARNIRNLTTNNADAGTRILTLGGSTAHASEFSGSVFLGTASATTKGVKLTAASGGTVTFSGVIQDPTGQASGEQTSAAALTAVDKVGDGTVILSNNNTCIGNTTVSTGCLARVGGSQTPAITVNSGALLGFTLGQSTTSTKVVNLTNGTVKISNPGAVDNSSDYLLMTAAAGFTLTDPITQLETVITDYKLQLQAGGTQLWLVYAPPRPTKPGPRAASSSTAMPTATA